MLAGLGYGLEVKGVVVNSELAEFIGTVVSPRLSF